MDKQTNFGLFDKFVENDHFYYRYYDDTLEECFILSENDYSAKPELLHGGVPAEPTYPLGSFLCICLNLLYEIEAQRILDSKNEWVKMVFETIDKYLPETEENAEKDAFSAFLYIQFFRILKSESKNEWVKICNFLNFAQLCEGEKSNCTQPMLDRFSILNKEIIPQGGRMVFDLFLEGKDEEMDYPYLYEKLEEYESQKELYKPIFNAIGSNVDSSSFHRSYTYYKLNSIPEFLLASMQTVFRARKIIKVCEHCGSFFVPQKRSDEKYCSGKSYKTGGRTCKEQVKLDNQLRREHANLSSIVHKRIRNKLYSRIGHYSNCEDRQKTYDLFLEQSAELRKYKDINFFTEQEYIDWMNNYYNNRWKIDSSEYIPENIPVIVKASMEQKIGVKNLKKDLKEYLK